MKVVGLTGGIGSGKSTVVGIFRSFGVPCYISDERAKILIHTSVDIQNKIVALLGEKSFENGVYQRKYVADKVFSFPHLLEKLNQIVHPYVREDFRLWKQEQQYNYVINESAILFESGLWRDCDAIICVEAPLKDRILRVMKRDNVSEHQVLQRISRQITDENRKKQSDFCIINENMESTYRQVEHIHRILSKKR